MTRTRARGRDRSRLGAIDYFLMSIGSCCAVYSGGMAVNQPAVAQFFVYTILAGSGFSLLVRSLLGKTVFGRADSLLYAIATVCAVILAPGLNSILPGDGIPVEVLTAAWLCWMLSFGSFLTWSDGTLLFQAVPSIALFGLVGCYDTFKPAPFFFFGFLLCLATLLARAHSREMLRQAVESGYFNRADAPNAASAFPEQSPELYEDIKRGPWRWIAGPEWALLSGLAIVGVSLLGAPVIRQAMAPLSGAISVSGPRMRRLAAAAVSSAPIPEGAYEVGRGPQFDVNSKPIILYEASLDRIRYLRVATYGAYGTKTWRALSPLAGRSALDFSLSEITRKHEFHMTIDPLVPTHTLPLPAEVQELNALSVNMLAQVMPNGGGSLDGTGVARVQVTGVESEATPVDADRDLPVNLTPEYLITDQMTADVHDFADAAAEGKKSDFEKAQAISQAISARCKYSLRAPAVPEGQDAAEFFLFKSKVGYCDLFATAMVLCARAEDIPARYVVGYLPDANNRDARGETAITDRDYHAWAELLFKGVGWVVFDPTAGAQELKEGDSFRAGPWQNWLAGFLNVAIAAGAVALGGVWLSGRLRKRKGRDTVRTDIEREYASFAKALQRASGRKRKLSETPDEYLEAVKPFLNGAGAAAERVNRTLVRALYGSDVISEEAAAAIKAEVKAFRKMDKRSPKV